MLVCVKATYPVWLNLNTGTRYQMTDIFREIDEDLRRDRAADIVRRYGGVAAGVALVIILGVGGWRFMEYRASQAAAEAGVRFEQAVKQLAEAGQAAEGVKALEALAASGPAGYPALARFRLASQQATTDASAGLAAFDALAADASLEQGLRDVARIRAATIAVDSASPEDIVKRVESLATPASQWRNQARELMGLAWMKAGKLAEAEKLFAQIAVDGEAPQSLRRRAQLFMELAAAGPVTIAQPAAIAPTPPGAAPSLATPSMTAPSLAAPPIAAPGGVTLPSPSSGAAAPATQN